MNFTSGEMIILHKVNYVDTAEVVSGSVSNDPDCRPCELKKEFNNQINASSAVIFVVGDKTASRLAGSTCNRHNGKARCSCTPYKQNSKGMSICKYDEIYTPRSNNNLGNINTYSYLEHEFRQSVLMKKTIIIVYNSLYNQKSWLPSYMRNFSTEAVPFWTKNIWGNKVGNYSYIKKALGYD